MRDLNLHVYLGLYGSLNKGPYASYNPKDQVVIVGFTSNGRSISTPLSPVICKPTSSYFFRDMYGILRCLSTFTMPLWILFISVPDEQ